MTPIVFAIWQEIWRKRVLLITVVLSMASLGLYFAFAHLQENNISSLGALSRYAAGTAAVVVGLYLMNFTVAFMSVFSAAGTISAEIESGLLLAILPRPNPRWKIYLGKWVGFATWSLIYGAVMYWIILAIAYQQLGYPLHWGELWQAFGLFELVPLVLVTLTAFGSLYLPTLSNGVAISLLFMMGVIGGFLGRLTPNPTVGQDKLVFFTNLLMPADAAYHRMVFELMGGASAPQVGFLGPLGAQGTVPSGAFVWYIVLYIAVFLGLGLISFHRRDI